MSEHKSADQILERWALPPEFDESGKAAMRTKARRKLPEAFGEMSDEWIADRVRMLMRDDIYHEAICTAGRDRIMRLSLQVTDLRQALKDLVRGHVNTLEAGRDRIVALGGDCDPVDVMERGDPYLRKAKEILGGY